MKPKPPAKKKPAQKSVRRAAKIGLLKCIFAELYTPTQLESVKFDSKVDYGMDREIVDFVAKYNRKFMQLDRPVLDFEVFKLCLLYILTPDIRRIVGDIEILDFDNHHCLEISKVEKIRREIYDYKHRPRHPAELHVGNLLDFIFKKIEPSYKYTEIIYFSMDSCNLESVLDAMCDAAPKKEHFTGHPGKMDHVVFVKALGWPERSYVISPDIYQMYPELKGFFSDPDGMAFYQNYMKYIGSRWPNMQESILDHVNAFTNQYFKWLISMLSFPDNLPLEIRWKYTPLGFPCYPGYVPVSKHKLLLRVFNYFWNGKERKKYVFVHDIRVIMMKLKMLDVEFVRGGEPIPPEQDEAPLVHILVQFSNSECVMKLLQVMCPRVYDYVDIVLTPFHSLTAIDDRCLPIVSPYNSHCIPDIQGMERIAQILMCEVQIGTRIPLNFRQLEALIKKMDALFTGNEPFKTMVDRQTVHNLMKDATELMGKYNGKVTNPSPHFAKLRANSSFEQKMNTFLVEYPQFSKLSARWRAIECPIPPDYKRKTPPGEPEVDLILGLIWKKEPKKQ